MLRHRPPVMLVEGEKQGFQRHKLEVSHAAAIFSSAKFLNAMQKRLQQIVGPFRHHNKGLLRGHHCIERRTAQDYRPPSHEQRRLAASLQGSKISELQRCAKGLLSLRKHSPTLSEEVVPCHVTPHEALVAVGEDEDDELVGVCLHLLDHHRPHSRCRVWCSLPEGVQRFPLHVLLLARPVTLLLRPLIMDVSRPQAAGEGRHVVLCDRDGSESRNAFGRRGHVRFLPHKLDGSLVATLGNVVRTGLHDRPLVVVVGDHQDLSRVDLDVRTCRSRRGTNV
mmetsp:Transcript_13725/g.31673  ORF Transcript_13725/g.31673 Transcript_13725/m.31673 type:complete len:280 (-) Transcript_13725:155-994(-)